MESTTARTLTAEEREERLNEMRDRIFDEDAIIETYHAARDAAVTLGEAIRPLFAELTRKTERRYARKVIFEMQVALQTALQSGLFGESDANADED